MSLKLILHIAAIYEFNRSRDNSEVKITLDFSSRVHYNDYVSIKYLPTGIGISLSDQYSLRDS